MGATDDDKIKKLKQTGLIAKGIVYVLVGGLTAMAAINWGGQTTGKSGTKQFISELPGGTILLILIGLGLLAYSFWRFYEGAENPDQKKNSKRAVFFLSGFAYLFLAFSFVKPVFGGSSQGSGEEKKQQILTMILEWPAGIWIVGGLALIVLIVAIAQFRKAFKGDFMEKLDNHPHKKDEHTLVYRVGKLGFTARGIVFLIISYFLLKVAMDHNADQYQGTKGVFNYIASMDYGQYLLLAVTIGLICYGVFNFLVARYTSLSRVS